MDVRAFVSGEPDEPRFAGFAGLGERLDRAAFGKRAVGIGHANDFVQLQEVEVIGLEPVEGFVDLFGGEFAGASVDLGHQERLGPVAVAQGQAHADFAGAIVVVPAVVEEIDAVIEGGPYNLNGFFLVGFAEVESADADDGNAFAGASELSERDVVFLFGRGPEILFGTGRDGSHHRDLQEMPSIHAAG